MEIVIFDKKIVIDKDKSIEDLISQINQELSNIDVFFSHIIVDGIEVYEDIPLYLEDNLKTTQKIEVVVKKEEQFIEELLLSSENYLKRALPEIEQLAGDLYNNNTEVWGKLPQLLEGINWVHQVIVTIDKTKKYNSWDKCVVDMIALNEKLVDFEEALGSKDLVLLGDIVKFEIYETLTNISNTITSLIDKEVKRVDVS